MSADPIRFPKLAGFDHPWEVARARQAAAVQLRREGKTYREIAEQLGYGCTDAAVKSIKRAYKATEVAEVAELALAEELDRLDGIVAAFWPGVQAGDSRAADVVLKAMAQRDKYLGLAKPKESHRKVTIEAAPAPPPDLDSYQLRVLQTLRAAGALPALDAPHHYLATSSGGDDPAAADPVDADYREGVPDEAPAEPPTDSVQLD